MRLLLPYLQTFFNHLVQSRRWGRLLVLTTGLLAGLAAAWLDVHWRQGQRLSLLQTEAQRTSLEIMSQTLNGNLMGSITLLGLIDVEIKREAESGLTSKDSNVAATLTTLGQAFGAEGVFVVGQDGIVKTSWDKANKPSTGLDVNFRPYFQMALRGQNSVYAAVSMARGDRSLYFAAPVFTGQTMGANGIGTLVARTDAARIDALLHGKFDHALLLSPQGVVFASSQPDWVGAIDEVPDDKRLTAIRQLKQFGAMFEKDTPAVLPMRVGQGIQTVAGVRYAVASAPVQWNDPSGEWRLVLMEDLHKSLGWGHVLQMAALAALAFMVLTGLLLGLARGRWTHLQAHEQLQAFARAQEVNLAWRAQLADVGRQFQHCDGEEALARVFLRVAREALQAPQGVVYLHDPRDNRLHLAASAASALAPTPVLDMGEGLLGQCAAEGKRRVLPVEEDGIWTLRSGLGNTRSAALVLLPLVLQDRVLGALELALLQPPDATAVQHMEELAAMLATYLEIQRRHAVHAPDVQAEAAWTQPSIPTNTRPPSGQEAVSA